MTTSAKTSIGEHRVLIIDDDDLVRDLLWEALSGAGFQVDVAAELEEAEALLSRRTYDSVISDLHLSHHQRWEGLEIASWLAQRAPRARLILMTGYGDDATRDEVRRFEVFGYFEKPFPVGRLVDHLRSLVPPSQEERPSLSSSAAF